jgi:AAA family ATP:ADP antiporter
MTLRILPWAGTGFCIRVSQQPSDSYLVKEPFATEGLQSPSIHNQKRLSLLLQAIMLFCVLFNFTILRNTKDVLVVTAPGSGAEVIVMYQLRDIQLLIILLRSHLVLKIVFSQSDPFRGCIFLSLAHRLSLFSKPTYNYQEPWPSRYCMQNSATK